MISKDEKRTARIVKKAVIAACLLFIVIVAVLFIRRYQITPQTTPHQVSPGVERIPLDTGRPESPAVPLIEEPSRIRKHQLQEAGRKYLVAQGLQDPINDLVHDLMNRNELIPCKGTVGGKPGFYIADGITVLSKDRVIADYDDGHVVGTIELTFTVSRGTITWEVVHAECGD